MVINFEDQEIQIFEILSLNSIKIIKKIPFENSNIIFYLAKTTTLQIVDNLIIIHYFYTRESSIIDLKKQYLYRIQNFNLANCPMSNFEIHQSNNNKDLINIVISLNDDDRNDDLKIKINYNCVDIIQMNSIENKAFCKKNINIDKIDLEIMGKMIYDKTNLELYYIYFDSKVYYDRCSIKVIIYF